MGPSFWLSCEVGQNLGVFLSVLTVSALSIDGKGGMFNSGYFCLRLIVS